MAEKKNVQPSVHVRGTAETVPRVPFLLWVCLFQNKPTIFRSAALNLSQDDSPPPQVFLTHNMGSNVSIYHQYWRLRKRTDNPWFPAPSQIFENDAMMHWKNAADSCVVEFHHLFLADQPSQIMALLLRVFSPPELFLLSNCMPSPNPYVFFCRTLLVYVFHSVPPPFSLECSPLLISMLSYSIVAHFTSLTMR